MASGLGDNDVSAPPTFNLSSLGLRFRFLEESDWSDWVMCLTLSQEVMGHFDGQLLENCNQWGWGGLIQMKVLVADEEEGTSARQNSAEVHCRALPGDGQCATGPKTALLGAGVVIAGSPHLENNHVRVSRP